MSDMEIVVYKREDGLWDWRMKAGNGEIIATSGGQGFTERNDATEAVERVLKADIDIVVVFEEDA
jgi:Uncharacterized conserved protein